QPGPTCGAPVGADDGQVGARGGGVRGCVGVDAGGGASDRSDERVREAGGCDERAGSPPLLVVCGAGGQAAFRTATGAERGGVRVIPSNVVSSGSRSGSPSRRGRGASAAATGSRVNVGSCGVPCGRLRMRW